MKFFGSMIRRKGFYCACMLLFFLNSFSQTDSTIILSFDFNDHKIKEVNDKLIIKPVGVTLTEDRFGNKNSAIYLHGISSSYINLGTSNLLKPKVGTISIWVNLQSKVLAGRGYPANPFFLIRNGPGDDFNLGLAMGLSVHTNRFGVQASKDSITECNLFSKDTVKYNIWYHTVLTQNNDYFAFYINGELQEKLVKGFESVFMEGDSVMLGRTIGYKNERYSHSILDDIRIYHRVLSEKEIKDLYNEPNPDRFKNILSEVMKYGLIALFVGIIVVIILIRNKRNLRKQKEYYELNNKIKELEIKVIKNQMNPHFISNCLAAIQNLIYTGEIDKAGEYIAKFSFFLREVLYLSEKNFTTLEQEITIIKLNVELEQLRFKSDFSFKLEIIGELPLHEILIPSLITQPFIENAIWHGLLPLKERVPSLNITIYAKDNIPYITIEDNGVGRTDQELNRNRTSRGTKLVLDKIESINQLTNSADFQLEIIDLFDEKGVPSGTKIVIKLSDYLKEE